MSLFFEEGHAAADKDDLCVTMLETYYNRYDNTE